MTTPTSTTAAATPSETTTSNPPPTTTTTTTAAAAPPSRPYLSPNPSPPLLPLPPPYAPHSIIGSILGRPPNAPAPSQAVLYPIGLPATRGPPPKLGARGPDQMVSVANPAAYMRSSGGPVGVVGYAGAHAQRGFGFPNSDHVAQFQQQQPPPLISTRPQGSPQFSVPRQVPVGGGGVSNGLPTTARASPASSHHKVSPFTAVSSVPEYNRHQDPREKARDNSVFMVHDRRVRFQDCRVQDCPSKSLYALCRSWVHNGVPQEIQPFFGGGVKLLPRPLPVPAVDSIKLEKTEDEEDEDAKEEMHINSLKNPSIHELLGVHVRRAKRIRAKLKQDRLHRIYRYKQRLCLLLPPHLVEPDKKNGSAGS